MKNSDRETVNVSLGLEKSFVMKLTNDELREIRRRAEGNLTTFGDGTRTSIRASDLISIIQELLNSRSKDDI